MSANVETMFYVREKPWHGLGTMVQEAPTSADALRLAGLDWTVEARDMWLNGGYEPIPGYKANVRSSDNKVLGVVSDKYRIVQNADAFAFTDALIGGDVHYETAGSLLDGKKIWLLAKLPDSEICGDKTEPYTATSGAGSMAAGEMSGAGISFPAVKRCRAGECCVSLAGFPNLTSAPRSSTSTVTRRRCRPVVSLNAPETLSSSSSTMPGTYLPSINLPSLEKRP